MAFVSDIHGTKYEVLPLARNVATERGQEIVDLHNSIPHQHWEIQHLLAERDDARIFHGKWAVSRIALDAEQRVAGFCIAFERTPDLPYYSEKCFYLHRLAIAMNRRGRGLGALLQAQTIVDLFLRGFSFVGTARDPVVIYGQTDSSPSNRNVLLFHRAAGFADVARKPYVDRTDVVMRADARSFWESRHVAFWRSHRVIEES